MNRRAAIRVLVIDDSAYSRQTIRRMLGSSPLVEVVGTSDDGDDALRQALEHQPDVITLDLHMPKMDGFTFLRLLMAHRPTPVIVVSSRVGEDDVFKALDLGAVDFVAKPASRSSGELDPIRDELIRKIHATRLLCIDKLGDRARGGPASAAPPCASASQRGARWPALVAIGASTGGPAALTKLFESFDAPPPFATLVAQHMPAGFTQGFAERLDRRTVFSVKEAECGDPLIPGTLLIAPGGANLSVAAEGARLVARISHEEVPTHCRPSVDCLFSSVAKHYGSRALGVILTGMGEDGRVGARALSDAGASVIAESQQSAVVFGMPKQAILSGAVDLVLPLWEIPAALKSGQRPQPCAPAGARAHG